MIGRQIARVDRISTRETTTMNRFGIMLALVAAVGSSAAYAKCADEIKALQGKAAGKDAATKPGNQNVGSSTDNAPSQGGGQASASAKVLEAQAHDQRGDEAACMEAIEAAKAASQ